MNIGKFSLLLWFILLLATNLIAQETEVEKAVMDAHFLFANKEKMNEALTAYKNASEIAFLDADKIEIGKGIQACAVYYHRAALVLEGKGEFELAKQKHKMAFDAFKDGEPLLGTEEINPLLQYYTSVSALEIDKPMEAIPYLENLKQKKSKPSIYHLLFLAYKKVEVKKAKQVLNEGIQKFPEDKILLKDAQMILDITDTGR